jgi:hypothetical protein
MPGRQDRHLVHRVGVLEHVGQHGVAALVVGDPLLLGVREHHALAALAEQDAVAGRLEVLHGDVEAAAAHGVQGGLVDQVGQVGAAHAGCAAGHDAEIDVVRHPLALAVDLQDRQPLLEVGQRHHDLAVEAPRPQQGGVQDVGAVGGRDHDDALGGVEAVHLREHLVEGLLALVVPAAEAGAALAADGVDLVDEDDGGRLLAGRLEQVAHPAGPDADEHLHEVRAADRHEGHAGLAGHGPGQERLAGPGGADQQHALGDLRPDLLEAGRGLQEVDDLADLLLDPGIAGHVLEGRRGAVAAERLGLGAPDGHDPRHLALGLAADEVDEGGADADDEDVGEQVAQQVGRRGREADRDAVVTHLGDVVGQRRARALDL